MDSVCYMKRYFKYKVMDQAYLNTGDVKTRSLMLIKWVAFAQLLMLSFSNIASASVQPRLTENQAVRIVDDAFKMQPLFWQGLVIPHRIERGSKHKNAAMLEVLFNHQLLIREKETQVIKIEGSNRKRIALNYRYSFADQHVGALIGSQGGFYYGYGRLKKVLQLSKPYFVGGFYYAEAYVQWYVTDIQDWVDAPAFDKARTLRRSLESKSKPFEKRVYLQYNGQDWALWKGKPGGL
ncbi:MAG: hypothetical protein ACI9EX_000326 [Oleispira sp.]|jgi:hypothetical protein